MEYIEKHQDFATFAIVVIVGILIGGVLLKVADQRQSYYNQISDCIWEEMEAQHFAGSIEQGWRLFADDCK